MQDYNDYDEHIEEEEQETHFFCKLTFGQFFTMMVLEIITLCFVFYLGARYGNEYLKLDVISETKREPIQIITEKVEQRREAVEEANTEDAELKTMARDALQGEKVDLKQKVAEILSRQQGPTTPPVGEPTYNEQIDQEYIQQKLAANNNMPESGLPPQQTHEINPYRPQTQGLEDTAAEEIVKVKSTDSAKFAVQVGAYPDVKEASYRVEEWKAKGYPAYMMIADLGEKGQWYRVRIGAFASKDEAGNYLNGIATKEGVNDAFVVKNEQ